MIPMRLELPGGGKASVTWSSVFWIGVVTTIGTVVGTYVYARWVQKFIPSAAAPGTTGTSS